MRRQFSLQATIFDKRGKVLAVGNNSYSKTHPLQIHTAKQAGRPDAMFLHAEIHALTKLKNNADKAHRIYIERYSKHGDPLPAKPCEICTLALQNAGIEIVEFT